MTIVLLTLIIRFLLNIFFTAILGQTQEVITMSSQSQGDVLESRPVNRLVVSSCQRHEDVSMLPGHIDL